MLPNRARTHAHTRGLEPSRFGPPFGSFVVNPEPVSLSGRLRAICNIRLDLIPGLVSFCALE